MMQQLRETVHCLELQHEETRNRLYSKAFETVTMTCIHHDENDDHIVVNNSTEKEERCQWKRRSGELMLSSSFQYTKLIEEAVRLKDENFYFRQVLHEKNKFQETLERWYDDVYNDDSLMTQEEKIKRRGVEDREGMTTDSWIQVTYDQVLLYIQDTHDRVTIAKQTIAQEAAVRKLDSTIRCLPPFLGWQVQYHRENDEVLFSFEKPFYHVTPLSAMLHTWDNELKMQSYSRPVDAAMQSMTLLQVINDDTYVLRRQLKCRDQVATNHYLRYRQRTSAGYVIGSCTVNRKPSQDVRQIWAANLAMLTDFDTAWSELNQEYCVVRISGRMSVEATDAAAHQAAVNLIFGLLRWENFNVGPVFTFTSN
ncbi:unnamed protein product [Peronospora belbahrii]|nr:unnamed protein product [Peronospora belbahrii]